MYALAIASYALQLAEHIGKDFILDKLNRMAMKKDDKMWFTKPIPEDDKNNIWYKRPNSINIEINAYAVLANIQAGHVSDAVAIMKWLVTQQSEIGGFTSTQDTVVGLEALAAVAQQINTRDSHVDITVNYGDGAETRLAVNNGNAFILQSYDLPASTRIVNITASGHRTALLQLTYTYNLNVTGAWPRFSLDPKVNRNSNADNLHLTVCTR